MKRRNSPNRDLRKDSAKIVSELIKLEPDQFVERLAELVNSGPVAQPRIDWKRLVGPELANIVSDHCSESLFLFLENAIDAASLPPCHEFPRLKTFDISAESFIRLNVISNRMEIFCDVIIFSIFIIPLTPFVYNLFLNSVRRSSSLRLYYLSL